MEKDKKQKGKQKLKDNMRHKAAYVVRNQSNQEKIKGIMLKGTRVEKDLNGKFIKSTRSLLPFGSLQDEKDVNFILGNVKSERFN